MAKKIVIPKCRNPFVVIVNGTRYEYESNKEIEVPDEVAEVIQFHVDSKPKPKPIEEGGNDGFYDAFWDAFQNYGNRDEYRYAFYGSGWDDTSYNPKYDIVCSSSAQDMFYSTRVTDTKVGIYLRAGTSTSSRAFSSPYLKSIRKLWCDEKTPFSNTFQNATGLVNLVVDGTIAQNGFSVQWSPLTRDSLMSIINALADKSEDTSGTEWKVNFGNINTAKLTDEDLAIAYQKGWVVN